MSYRLVFTDSYNKKAAKWIKKHPTLKDQYLKTLQLMELDIHHPSLRVSINMSYRITLELIIQDRDIILINIGSHDEVYRW
ncbi:MAG: plasmid stabilization protein [Rhodobacterales bacterium]|nr:plasmid stabilization protein [Rhodobacterales bacterium]